MADSMREARDARAKTGGVPMDPKPKALRQSMVYSYLQCPSKFYYVYEGRGKPEGSIFTALGTAIHGVMEDLYSGVSDDIGATFDKWWKLHAPDDPQWYKKWREIVTDYFAKHDLQEERKHVLALERQFEVEVNGVPLSGTIDRIDRVDEDTIRIIDYKTNQRPWTKDELENSIQFKMYALALFALQDEQGEYGPFDRIICTYEMLRLGIRQEIVLTREDLADFAGWLKIIWDKILSGVDREPRINQYCGHCALRFKCPAFREAIEGPPMFDYETLNVDALDEERERLTNIKKLVDQRLREIDEIIKTMIAESSSGTVVLNGNEYSVRSTPRYTYPAHAVADVMSGAGLAHLFLDTVSVSNTQLKRVLKDHPEVLERLDEHKEVTYTSPSIVKRKVK